MTTQAASISKTFQVSHSLRQVICNDVFEAVFQPMAGGRLLSLRHVDHGDLLVPLHDESIDLNRWPKAGAFPLFPFHNRLRDAVFRHDGKTIQLEPNSANGKDVLHGPAHRRPWNVTELAPSLLEMSMDYQADNEWPFDFRATQRFKLDNNRLTIRLGLTNTGRTMMPGGFGWHPYFRHSTDEQIRIIARRQWDPFGLGGRSEAGKHDLGTPVASIPHDIAQHYSGWTTATIQIQGGATISLLGDADLSCLTALQTSQYLCLEPTSHVAGALEALPDACPETGMRLMYPGKSHYGTVSLSIS